jgi:hypothetical protein
MFKARKVAVMVGAEDSSLGEGKILELAVLLPAWQVSALERTACLEGQTIGQLLRRLIGDFLDGAPGCRLDQSPYQDRHVLSVSAEQDYPGG